MNYINLPIKKTFAWAPRSGSTAILRALITTYFPERFNMRVHTPTGVLVDPHALAQSSLTHAADHEVVILVRDPVERFRSACARTGKSITQGLASLNTDPHFTPYSIWFQCLPNHLKVFRFETEFDECTKYLGIGIIPQENVGENKPILTDEDLVAVQLAYAEDFDLLTRIFLQPDFMKSEQSKLDIREIDKLQLVERLITKKKLTQFVAFLDSGDGLLRFHWDSAQILYSDHPLFTTHAPFIKNALNLTDKEFSELIA